MPLRIALATALVALVACPAAASHGGGAAQGYRSTVVRVAPELSGLGCARDRRRRRARADEHRWARDRHRRLRGRAVSPVHARGRLREPALSGCLPQRRPVRERRGAGVRGSEGSTRLEVGGRRGPVLLARPPRPLDEPCSRLGRWRRHRTSSTTSSTGPCPARLTARSSPSTAPSTTRRRRTASPWACCSQSAPRRSRSSPAWSGSGCGGAGS